MRILSLSGVMAGLISGYGLRRQDRVLSGLELWRQDEAYPSREFLWKEGHIPSREPGGILLRDKENRNLTETKRGR